MADTSIISRLKEERDRLDAAIADPGRFVTPNEVMAAVGRDT